MLFPEPCCMCGVHHLDTSVGRCTNTRELPTVSLGALLSMVAAMSVIHSVCGKMQWKRRVYVGAQIIQIHAQFIYVLLCFSWKAELQREGEWLELDQSEVRNQEILLSPPPGCRGSGTLATIHCIPWHISKEQPGLKQVSIWDAGPTLAVYLICHNTVPM